MYPYPSIPKNGLHGFPFERHKQSIAKESCFFQQNLTWKSDPRGLYSLASVHMALPLKESCLPP